MSSIETKNNGFAVLRQEGGRIECFVASGVLIIQFYDVFNRMQDEFTVILAEFGTEINKLLK